MDMLEKNIYALSVPTIINALSTFDAAPNGTREYSFLDIHDLLKKGIPWEFVFKVKRRTGLDGCSVASFLGVSVRTLQRVRKNQKANMSRDVSEHAVRLAVVILAAFALFDGYTQSALEWLQNPASSLAGRVPFKVAETGIGAKEVLRIMGHER